MKKIAKAKSGKSFGMLSVKAGIDKNPNPTAADRIAGAKMNAGKAKNGKTMKAQKGASVKERVVEKSIDLPKMGFPKGNSPGYARTKFNPGTPKGKDANKDYSTYKFTKLPGYEGIKDGQLTRKKPVKKAQDGTTQYMELPEATVTASRIVDKPTKTSSSQKSKPSNSYRDIIRRSNKMNRNQSGFSRMNPRKRFEDGGEVSMAKKGTSVKKKMMNGGKCKNGC